MYVVLTNDRARSYTTSESNRRHTQLEEEKNKRNLTVTNQLMQ